MPRYFFDVLNGASVHTDVAGQQLPDENAARGLALQTLADMAPEEILRGGEALITVRVRREGVPVYSVPMTLSDQWIRLDA